MTSAKHAALLKLFSDDDPAAIQLLERSFCEKGSDSIPILNQVVAKGSDLARRNAERILSAVQQQLAGDAFAEFCRRPSDLESGVFLLAATRYPTFARERYTRQLDGIADALRDKVSDQAPRHAIESVSRQLFEELGFRGNTEHYYDPDNSFINSVLDRRLGIPITLSALYLFVAKRLELPLVGVGMPGHFIVKWQRSGEDELLVDPFNRGQIVTRDECVSLLSRGDQTFSPEMLSAATTPHILARMCNNLVAIFRQTDEAQYASRYERFAEELSS